MNTDTTRKPVTDYELIDHGVEGSQYFQGCGVACTSYDLVQTGCGENFAAALDDCLESIAQGIENVDTEDLERRGLVMTDLWRLRIMGMDSPSSPS